ncbi:serine/threonine-protein kinase [Actinacidiphila yeochonensis]|uniref:serine/threonine-protein kinase n=1 Tax=Actinacidiphila yeochonensis TaxID=89050 RepID=UPI00056BA3ED|nr:serine/threonine-protein kinase [Actinacidiphila yeochonensis]
MGGYVDEGRLVAGRYRLVQRIGRGGMGTVWRAEDEILGRQVAVKKLHPPQPHMDDEDLATLFERTRREARAAARISHPNVIVVHDVVDDAGLPSIVMEYVPSMTLGERLKESGPLEPAEAARIGRGMIAALRAAHRAGVLHRDVKPGNVLLGAEGDGSRVVLTDFGIAQASGTSTLTRTGELIGSIDFLSPERIRGLPPGPEGDMWALGATLYQAVEGVSPFRRATAIETAYAIAQETVEPPARAGVLSEVIAGLMAKEPGERLSAEDAERMLRVPAAEFDTTLVQRGRLPRQRSETADAADAYPSVPSEPSEPSEPSAPSVPPVPSAAATAAPDGPATGHGQGAPPVTATHRGQPPARPRRRAVWVAVAVAVVVVAAGTGFALAKRGSHTEAGSTGRPTAAAESPTATAGTPTQPPTQSPSPSATTPSASPPPPLPDGYHLATEADHGYAIPVPEGWTRSTKNGGDEVNWVDPSGVVDLKVNALEFGSTDPLQHFKDLEPQTEQAVGADGYHRERMQPTTAFGDKAALWEFTFKGSVRDWHAIDLDFTQPGGTEYAIYLSAPQTQWQQWLPVFNNAVAGFRQGSAAGG